MGMEFRPYYLAREWVRLGHHVRIVAGDYSHLRVKNPEVSQDFQEEFIDGITYTWIRTGAYEGNGVKRALSMGRFVGKLMAKARWIAQTWKPDVIITSSTYPLDTYAGQRIRRFTKPRAKLIHEVHDMWPATLYEVGGMSKKHPFVVVMQIAENSAYKHCDACVSLAPYTKAYMVEHGLAPEKFINIQNGVVEDEWNHGEEIPLQHKQFFSDHKDDFIVGYFGGHALSNALDLSLDVAKCFLDDPKEADTIFVLVGDGVDKERLMSRAVNEQISNVFFLPPVSKKAVPDLLRHFDCSYMTGMPSPLYRFGLCLNKMYDSMMAGIPIICAFDAPETLVGTYGCGIECNPAKPEGVAGAIRRIRSLSPEERDQMGKKGKKAILEHFTYEQLAKQFENVFRESNSVRNGQQDG